MNTETHNKAVSLIEEINKAKVNLDIWERSTSLYIEHFGESIPVRTSGNSTEWPKVSPDAFKTVKDLNVSYWKYKVDRLEKEFEAL